MTPTLYSIKKEREFHRKEGVPEWLLAETLVVPRCGHEILAIHNQEPGACVACSRIYSPEFHDEEVAHREALRKAMAVAA